MPGTRITSDATGRLLVPDDPIIPIVEGDGAGPALWRVARAVLDAAVTAAYGPKRRLHYLELPAGDRGLRESRTRAPEATVNAFRVYRAGLCGALRAAPGPSLHGELREILDLFATVLHLRSPVPAAPRLDLVLVRDERERGAAGLEFPAGSAAAKLALAAVAAGAGEAVEALPFATAARADAQRAAQGDLETGEVEAALTLRDASRFGTQRFVQTALATARAAGRRRVTLVVDRERLPLSEAATLAWAEEAARAADARFVPPGEAVPAGGVVLETARATGLVARLLRRPESFEVLAGDAATIAAVVDVLAARVGNSSLIPAGYVNRETGHALFGPLADREALEPEPTRAQPLGMIVAGEALLRHLGWTEAADRLRKAVEQVLGSGQVPAVLAPAVLAAGVAQVEEIAAAKLGDALVQAVRGGS